MWPIKRIRRAHPQQQEKKMAMAMGLARVFGCSVASASGRVVGASRVVTGTPQMVGNDSVFTLSKRFASKKAGGSTKNGRDSESKRLGVKKFGGYVVWYAYMAVFALWTLLGRSALCANCCVCVCGFCAAAMGMDRLDKAWCRGTLSSASAAPSTIRAVAWGSARTTRSSRPAMALCVSGTTCQRSAKKCRSRTPVNLFASSLGLLHKQEKHIEDNGEIGLDWKP